MTTNQHVEIAVQHLEAAAESPHGKSTVGRRKYPPPSNDGPTIAHVLCYALCRLDYLSALLAGDDAEDAYTTYCACVDKCEKTHTGD